MKNRAKRPKIEIWRLSGPGHEVTTIWATRGPNMTIWAYAYPLQLNLGLAPAASIFDVEQVISKNSNFQCPRLIQI